MAEYHVIARDDGLDSEYARYRFDCPNCNRQAENSPLMEFEVEGNKRAVFCGRWGCNALLHVRIASGRPRQH